MDNTNSMARLSVVSHITHSKKVHSQIPNNISFKCDAISCAIDESSVNTQTCDDHCKKMVKYMKQNLNSFSPKLIRGIIMCANNRPVVYIENAQSLHKMDALVNSDVIKECN